MFYSSTFHLPSTPFAPKILATGWNFLNPVRYLIISAMLGGEHRDVSATGKATRCPLATRHCCQRRVSIPKGGKKRTCDVWENKVTEVCQLLMTAELTGMAHFESARTVPHSFEPRSDSGQVVERQATSIMQPLGGALQMLYSSWAQQCGP